MGGKWEEGPRPRRGGQSPDPPGEYQGEGLLSPQDILETWVLWWLVCLACLTSQLWSWIDLLYCIHFALGIHKNGGVLAQREENSKSPGGLWSWGRSESLVRYSYGLQINRVVGYGLLSVYRLLSISAAICIHTAVSPIQLRRRGKCTSWAKEKGEK